MRKISYLCCSFILLFSAQLYPQTTKTLRVATGEWPPYISQKLPNQGCVAAMLKDAFSVKDYRLEFTFFPWKRAYLESKQGHYDLTAYWFDSEQRRADFLFPEQNISIEKSYFYSLKKSKFIFNSFKDLQGMSLIVNTGYTYSDAFWEQVNANNISVFKVASEQQNFKMLLAGRADLTVISKKTADDFIAGLTQSEQEQIVRSKKPALVTKGYILMPKNNSLSKLLIKHFEQGFKQIMSDQNYQQNYRQNCSDY